MHHATEGKTALIAGASRNIGKAIALTIAREGANLALVARRMSDVLHLRGRKVYVESAMRAEG